MGRQESWAPGLHSTKFSRYCLCLHVPDLELKPATWKCQQAQPPGTPTRGEGQMGNNCSTPANQTRKLCPPMPAELPKVPAGVLGRMLRSPGHLAGDASPAWETKRRVRDGLVEWQLPSGEHVTAPFKRTIQNQPVTASGALNTIDHSEAKVGCYPCTVSVTVLGRAIGSHSRSI